VWACRLPIRCSLWRCFAADGPGICGDVRDAFTWLTLGIVVGVGLAILVIVLVIQAIF
jgi:hypothetical protein